MAQNSFHCFCTVAGVPLGWVSLWTGNASFCELHEDLRPRFFAWRAPSNGGSKGVSEGLAALLCRAADCH
jgi:hypothetical protein